MASKWDAIGRPDLDPLRRVEPDAARLRREGQLWPENLSDAGHDRGDEDGDQSDQSDQSTD